MLNRPKRRRFASMVLAAALMVVMASPTVAQPKEAEIAQPNFQAFTGLMGNAIDWIGSTLTALWAAGSAHLDPNGSTEAESEPSTGFTARAVGATGCEVEGCPEQAEPVAPRR